MKTHARRPKPAILAVAVVLQLGLWGQAGAKNPVQQEGMQEGAPVQAADLDLDARRVFSIPEQPLADALLSFSEQAGIQVMTASADLGNLTSPAVSGEQTLREALSSLLQNTGLKFHVVSDDAVAIEPIASRSTGLEGTALSLGEGSPSTGDALSVGEGEAGGAAADSESADQAIVVTGTNIRGADPASPIIRINRREIDRSGYSVVSDVIRSLPQNYGGGNTPENSVGSTPPGLPNRAFSRGTSPNLRGLGSSSTLTLVNGRRLAEDTIGAPDISGIPLDAVERVEIVTDGASAVYGSDAVAGVVNFILRRDMDGQKTTFEAGAATEGGASLRRFSQLFGRTWLGGNLLLTYEHFEQGAVFADQRDFTRDARDPQTLLPETNRDSIFAAARQQLAPGASIYFEGFYTDRGTFVNQASTTTAFPTVTDTEQYSLRPGAEVELPGSWSFSLNGNLSEHRNHLQINDTSLTTGAVTPRPPESSRGQLRSIELMARGALLTLPAGAVRLAVGAGLRREELVYTEVRAAGSRSARYAYGELLVPVIRSMPGFHRLDLTASIRSEHYSDFGTSTVPKFGMIYAPFADLVLRASWGESFRAPTLANLNQPPASSIFIRLPDMSGQTYALATLGGNPDLRPERAETLSLSAEYRPSWLQGLRANASYFEVDYRDRIGTPPNPLTALVNPALAAFVTRNPTPEQLAFFTDRAGIVNVADIPYDPAIVGAIIDVRPINVTRWRAHGVDLQLGYETAFGQGQLAANANLSFLDLKQRLTPTSAVEQLSGTSFRPPEFRARVGLSYQLNSGWGFAGIVNHASGARNVFAVGSPRVDDWTTIDAQLSYTPPAQEGWSRNLRIALSAQNLFNTAPPLLVFDTVNPGIRYDPTNATPLGRYVRLAVSKEW